MDTRAHMAKSARETPLGPFAGPLVDRVVGARLIGRMAPIGPGQDAQIQRAPAQTTEIRDGPRRRAIVQILQHVVTDNQIVGRCRAVLGYRTAGPAVPSAQKFAELEALVIRVRELPQQGFPQKTDAATRIQNPTHGQFQIINEAPDEAADAFGIASISDPCLGVSVIAFKERSIEAVYGVCHMEPEHATAHRCFGH